MLTHTDRRAFRQVIPTRRRTKLTSAQIRPMQETPKTKMLRMLCGQVLSKNLRGLCGNGDSLRGVAGGRAAELGRSPHGEAPGARKPR